MSDAHEDAGASRSSGQAPEVAPAPLVHPARLYTDGSAEAGRAAWVYRLLHGGHLIQSSGTLPGDGRAAEVEAILRGLSAVPLCTAVTVLTDLEPVFVAHHVYPNARFAEVVQSRTLTLNIHRIKRNGDGHHRAVHQLARATLRLATEATSVEHLVRERDPLDAMHEASHVRVVVTKGSKRAKHGEDLRRYHHDVLNVTTGEAVQLTLPAASPALALQCALPVLLAHLGPVPRVTLDVRSDDLTGAHLEALKGAAACRGPLLIDDSLSLGVQ